MNMVDIQIRMATIAIRVLNHLGMSFSLNQIEAIAMEQAQCREGNVPVLVSTE